MIVNIHNKVFKKILCFLGIHSWKWKYIKPDSCQQIKICNRCGKEKKRIEHNWGEWQYKALGLCFQERVCQRCELKEDGSEKHSWGEWQYKESGSCSQIRRCRRCNNIESGHKQHQWDVWKYDSPTSCVLKRNCLRCHESYYNLGGGHQWNNKGVCKRCGKHQ